MGRPTNEKEEKEFRIFIEGFGKDIGIEVFHGHNELIKQNCGKGLYEEIRKALLQSKQTWFILLFEDHREKSCWFSPKASECIVVNMAKPAGLFADIQKILADRRVKSGALK